MLRKVLGAQGQLRYSGKRVLELKVAGERQRYIELVTRDGQRQRIEYPEGSPLAGQVIVEDGKTRMHYYPVENVIRTEPQRFDEAAMRFRRTAQLVRAGRLRMTAAPGEAVAMQQTVRLSFSDPQGNVVQNLWADRRTGLILKRELFDRVGARAGYFEFLSINYQPVVRPKDFVLGRKGARVIDLEQELREGARRLGLSGARIPPGEAYQLRAVRVVKLAGTQVLTQLYAGPGGSLSLFETASTIDKRRLQRLAARRVSVHNWTAGGRSFALVGDQPRTELLRLAKVIGP